MTVTQKIQKYINKLAEGTTFKYDQLAVEPQEYVAAAKAIERLIIKGIIKRVSTGVFYKPKETVFGELKPNEAELLKPYLFEKGKRVAYITGILLYNRLGLTTQVPKSIKIASRAKRITVLRGNLKATPVKSYVDVTDKNFFLLEILDALKDFNKIPDLDKNSAIKIISKKLKELTLTEIRQLIKCSLAYPPRVRGFVGALLESINTSTDLAVLKKSLNPLSEYEYGIESILSTAKNWNIK
ncbi:MAG: hypothetical protein IPM47_03510 [Sphingobacteriales bacterium]|nr:MAG: hypothetical protein IPM47_03510 [Sphingobacteriales bacterium]